jgi:hypothetical protein
MFREIRGVEQRKRNETRRWFQDEYFDLFTTQNREDELQWFQLCYARDTWRERVLEWRRGRGFQHMKHDDVHHDPIRKDSGVLMLDGLLPFTEVDEKLEAAMASLPADIAALVRDKLREYAHPPRKFRPLNARTPAWLRRLRERQRVAVRLRFLDGAD